MRKKKERERADRDRAEITLNLAGVRPPSDPARAARPDSRFVDSGVDSSFVETAGQNTQPLTDDPMQRNDSIPNVTIEPIGDPRDASCSNENSSAS